MFISSQLIQSITHWCYSMSACDNLKAQLAVKLLSPNHLLLDSAPNLGPLISLWEINKFEDCWYKSVRILEVLKLLFQQSLNLSSSQRDMSCPILGDLSNNRWSGVSTWQAHKYQAFEGLLKVADYSKAFKIVLHDSIEKVAWKSPLNGTRNIDHLPIRSPTSLLAVHRFIHGESLSSVPTV
jgi:hypothetical protein